MEELDEYLKPSRKGEDEEEEDKENRENGNAHVIGDGLQNTIEYINQQLDIHGFPSPLKFFENTRENVTQVIHCILRMLQERQKDSGYREELNDQYRRLLSDHEMLSTNMKNLKTRLELSEREVDSLKSKLQWTEDKRRIEATKNRLLNDDLTKTKLQCQYTKTQTA
ncbi:9123_t:CDS:2, partial [Ambispora leptoticha]